jgi:uncharacterized membrane protein
MKPSVALTVLILGLLGSRQVMRAAAYTYTTVDVPGATFTTAYAINNVGQIVGIATGFGAFLDTHGVFTSISVPGYPSSAALSINDAGQIVLGVFDLSYLYSGGVFTPILVPGTATVARGINNAGQIVGNYGLENGSPNHGFVDTNGVFTTIDAPGATFGTAPLGINDRGQIIGTFVDSSRHSHEFLDTNGVFTTIEVPGALSIQLSGINNAGQIVGEYVDSSGHAHGFLDTNGNFTTIDVPGAQVTNLFGINDAGQIVGNFGDSIGPGHEDGFLATPTTTPEPASLPLFASGLAGIIILIVRRRIARTSTY